MRVQNGRCMKDEWARMSLSGYDRGKRQARLYGAGLSHLGSISVARIVCSD